MLPQTILNSDEGSTIMEVEAKIKNDELLIINDE